MPVSSMIRLGLGLVLAALVMLAPAAADRAIVEKGFIRLGGTPLQLISALDSPGSLPATASAWAKAVPAPDESCGSIPDGVA